MVKQNTELKSFMKPNVEGHTITDTLKYLQVGNPDTALAIFAFKYCESPNFETQKEEQKKVEREESPVNFIRKDEDNDDSDDDEEEKEEENNNRLKKRAVIEDSDDDDESIKSTEKKKIGSDADEDSANESDSDDSLAEMAMTKRVKTN